MIDIHNHILYKVDDGAKSIEESLSILRQLNDMGFTDFILTLHYIKDSSYISENKENNIRLSKLKQQIEDSKICVNLYLGNEIYICDDINQLIEKRKVISLSNTKY